MTTSPSQTSIEVQPATLLVRVPASTSFAALQAELALHRMWLPIVPLDVRLSLAELVRRNVGGRYQMRYGTLAHYIRAATLAAPTPDQPPLTLGGPTLKRATGYGLARALVAGASALPPDLGELLDITLHVRPTPPDYATVLYQCATLADAVRFADAVLTERLALRALAVREAGTQVVVLADLEGLEQVLTRQQATLAQGALHVGATPLAPDVTAWYAWERAARTAAHDLSVLLPRAAMPALIEQARQLARRYHLILTYTGDLGAGVLRLALHPHPAQPVSATEIAAARSIIAYHAVQHGAALSSDSHTPPPILPRPAPRTLPAPRNPPAPSARSKQHASPFVRQLQAVVGAEYVLTRPADLLTYSQDASIARPTGQPRAVVLPRTTAEVQAVMQLADHARVPVVTRGAGSGLAGGAVPDGGALVLALTRLTDLSIDAPQQIAHVGAGVPTLDVQRAAEKHGLLYAPDPSSQGISSIGGNIACNAGGPRCLKYGVTANYVTGVTAVLADGQIVQVGDAMLGQTLDASLLHLLIGSEGTLAIVTEATLRLIPLPAARRTTLALFPDLDSACRTVEQIMAAGVLPASLELMDDTTLTVVEEYLQLGLPRDAGAMLLLLADGEPEQVAWESAQLAHLAHAGGASSVKVAQTVEDEARFWQARRAVSPALARVRPNKISEDICVPIPKIAATVQDIKAISAQYDLPIPVFGHAGDGNLHPNVLFDARDANQTERAWQAAEAIFRVALAQGGTLSGEHGIGVLKRPFLAQALGEAVLELHQRIKQQYDPHRLLNPGKMLE